MKKWIISIIVIIIFSGLGFGAYSVWNNKNYDKFVNEKNNNFPTQVEESIIPIFYIDDIEEGDTVKVIGTMYTGTLNVNDEISIVGLGKKEINTKIKNLKIEKTAVNTISSGDKAIIEINSEINEKTIKKGQAVILSGTTKPKYSITAKIVSTQIDINSIKEQGNIFFINVDIPCTIKEVSEEQGKVKISLDRPIPIEKGIECKIKNNSEIIATAIIVYN